MCKDLRPERKCEYNIGLGINEIMIRELEQD
jgi:hypothetical protein